jgi:hypothetical protein
MNKEHISLAKFCLKKIWALRFFLKIIFIIIFLKVLYSFDPFGLSSVTAFHSKTLFYQLTSHQYKHGEKMEKNPVTVVILRDESFRGKGIWPVNAIVHADILESIRELKA